LPSALVQAIVQATKVADVDEGKLNEVIDKVLSEQTKAVEDFKSGKETVIMFLVGQVMRQFPEKIDSGKVKESLLSKLK
jgi:aspartyl-tRNA(Asn)/glutamyl-tRNA(Gln) amidotransferase subunit B